MVFWWGKRYFSAAVGLLAVLLFSQLPPVLAHAALATTDMAITGLLSLAFLTGMIWMEDPTRQHALWFGAASGLMMLSKFSCVGFFPAGVGLALLCYFAFERPGAGELVAAVRERIPTFSLAVSVACLLIWAGYRFSFGQVAFVNFRLPAPELWAGIQAAMRHSTHGHPAYLLGEARQLGWWYFFEVALAVKTPLGYLILLIAGVAFIARKSGRTRAAWIALAFSTGILVVGMISRLNIGLRHVLPVYVGFSIVAALAIVQFIRMSSERKWISILPAALLAWSSGHPPRFTPITWPTSTSWPAAIPRTSWWIPTSTGART